METLRGTIETITFRNAESGWTVLHLKVQHDTSPITSRNVVICVGTMPTLEQGENVSFCGEWTTHERFGRQFTVKTFETVRPTTAQGILQLLCSGYIANVGETRAKRMVDVFGEKTLDVLDNNPERLGEVSGIGPKIRAKIIASWEQQKHLRSLMVFLQDFGITLNMAYKIHRAYGAGAQSKISANPYVLVEDIWGVGFKRADAIAQKMGFDVNSYKRIRAGVVHLLSQAAGEGHTYLPENELLDTGAGLLGVERSLVQFSLDQVAAERIIVREENRCYLPYLHRAESAVGSLLDSLLTPPKGSATANADFVSWMNTYSQHTGWQPDPKQVQACREALHNGVFILTGGPGTGKTTTLQVIVSYLKQQGLRVRLAAPTGRAAQRMGTVAGCEALTIHRLLEYRPGPHGFVFNRNSANPVEADVVIVDEVSMIDILLISNLLEALPNNTRIVFVGDSNQLPSVGAGNVLADMISSGRIPHVELTTIFRQAAQSTIVVNAHKIIHNEVPYFANAKTDNCFFIPAEEPEAGVTAIIDLVCSRLPKTYNLDPMTDIQVLTPMHRGLLGTQNLNLVLQRHLNANPRHIIRGETRYCEGDKVMQVQNNYDNNVFNGDIGFVAAITDEDELVVDFDGNRVTYRAANLDELTHAYCISIHKSQGCEFKCVVIPVSTQHYIMLQRNLFYTALTRARTLCVFVGQQKALRIAVNNNEARHRYSRLAEKIKNCTPSTHP